MASDGAVSAVEHVVGCVERSTSVLLVACASCEGGVFEDELAPPFIESVAGERDAVDSLAREGVEASLQHTMGSIGCSCGSTHMLQIAKNNTKAQSRAWE